MYREAVILIHGMIPGVIPSNPGHDILAFFNKVRSRSQVLQVRFPDSCIFNLEWGHVALGESIAGLRPDQKLMLAENEVIKRVLVDPHHSVVEQREIVRMIQENLLIPGIGDVVYFAGEGANQIQTLIREQIINGLRKRIQDFDAPDVVVRLHVIAASLGVSIGYEFLANIFNQSPRVNPPSDYDGLRDLAGSSMQVPFGGNPKIQLGTFLCAASQLPLLLLRKQEYVNLMAAGGQIDPSLIGLRAGKTQAWTLFHDVNDVLSFRTKALFKPSENIVEIDDINNSRPPGLVERFSASHTGYWKNDEVLQHATKVLESITDDHGI